MTDRLIPLPHVRECAPVATAPSLADRLTRKVYALLGAAPGTASAPVERCVWDMWLVAAQRGRRDD